MGQTLLNRGGPEFDARIMCEGGERLTSRRCQGVSMCIDTACRSILSAYMSNVLVVVEQKFLAVMYSLVYTEMKQ
jgi:hypothetical protein